MMKRKIFFILFFLILSLSLFSTTYYVDATDGDDTKNGQSEANAWKTIAKVNSEMGTFVGGDEILFQRGETFTDARLTITCDGNGTHIVFGAYGTGDNPLFDGSVEELSGCILINDAGDGHITVQDIDVTGLTHGNETGIGVINQHDNIIIQRCTVSNVSNNGIFVSHTDIFLIKDCVVHPSVGNSGIVIYGSSANNASNGTIDGCVTHGAGSNDGITFHNNGTGQEVGSTHLIKNCISYDNAENGFDITSGSNITVQDCESYGNDQGAFLWGNSDNGIIQRCHIHDEDDEGIIVGSVATSLIIKNNIIESCANYPIMLQAVSSATGVDIYHNTVEHHSSGTHVYVNGNNSDVEVKNNIFTSTSSGNPSVYVYYVGSATPANTTSDWDYNIYWNPDNDDSNIFRVGSNYYNLANWQGTHSMDANSVWDNPDVVDPGNDWHLTSGSPCENNGTNVGVTDDYDEVSRPQDGDYDIGALELPAAGSPSNWMSGYSYRKKFTIQGVYIDAQLTYFPLHIEISDNDVGAVAQNDGDDVIFTKSDGTTQLDHDLRYFNIAAGTATGVWKVSASGWSIESDGSTYGYMYYGNAGAGSTEDAANTYTSDYQLVWPLDEAAGNAIDVTGNGNTGTFQGNLPDQQTGLFYKAQDLDGTGDYISSVYQITTQGNFTVSLWFNTTNTDANRYLCSQYDGVGFLSYHHSDDTVRSIITDDDPTSITANDGNTYAAGTWRLLTVYHDNDNSKWTSRINDAAKDENDASGIGTITEDDNFMVGEYASSYFLGRIQEVMVTNTVLTDSWTKFYYRNITEADNEITWGSQESVTGNSGFFGVHFLALAVLILPNGTVVLIGIIFPLSLMAYFKRRN